MKPVLPLAGLTPEDAPEVGGKAWALSRIARAGFQVPPSLCVTTAAYRAFVTSTGLGERILLELSRKDMADMRWEEMWDAALRIRNFFLHTPIPEKLHDQLTLAMDEAFDRRPVVVRSSAPEEDATDTSFAGLHDSFVNVRGAESIVHHILLVWASLWSDAALLYRQKIGLNPTKSTMAVLVQELVPGAASGVVFTVSPLNREQAVLEAVHGLNQGLVDGTVQPDRWEFARSGLKLLRHLPAKRIRRIVPADSGTRLEELDAAMEDTPPMTENHARTVLERALELEELFNAPQDVEWTMAKDGLVILQSRPITTMPEDAQERQRRWYLSLRRDLTDLKRLRITIEQEHLPAMREAARRLRVVALADLSTHELAATVKKRAKTLQYWTDVYWTDFIPFAHGMRLFGQVYNEMVNPEDPYAFLDLLAHAGLESMRRNERLMELARAVRDDPNLLRIMQSGALSELPEGFNRKLESFVVDYGDLSCPVTGATDCTSDSSHLVNLLAEMAGISLPAATRPKDDPARLEKRFLSKFPPGERGQAETLLDLARASYRLRDDDNIHLGRIEAQLLTARHEAEQRLAGGSLSDAEQAVLRTVLAQPVPRPEHTESSTDHHQSRVGVRQLRGQPAGPGSAAGPARVVTTHDELAGFKQGEILVCDALDPNMTFVVPLAAAVVERRGGMLIHGAIIAREYGLPCVTGIPGATEVIHTGDHLTVDGHLGLVTLRRGEEIEGQSSNFHA